MNLAQALCNDVLLKSHFGHPFYVLLFVTVVGESSSLSLLILTPSKKRKRNWLGCVRIQRGPPGAGWMAPVSPLPHWQDMEAGSTAVAGSSVG